MSLKRKPPTTTCRGCGRTLQTGRPLNEEAAKREVVHCDTCQEIADLRAALEKIREIAEEWRGHRDCDAVCEMQEIEDITNKALHDSCMRCAEREDLAFCEGCGVEGGPYCPDHIKHDAEGVPLCPECWESLKAEAVQNPERHVVSDEA